MLAEYPTGGPRRERFELSIAECRGDECPVQVRLLDDAGARGAVTLDWTSTSRAATRASSPRVWGTGDPADTARVGTWVTGEEEEAIETAARLVTLAPGVRGLLLWQEGGFEHTKRRHYVVAPVAGRLERVWTGHEPGGPAWSGVAVNRDAAGVDRLVLYGTTSMDAYDTPDLLEAAILVWDGRALTEGEGAAPLVGVAAGRFADLSAARDAQDARGRCLDGFRAVPPPGGGDGITLLAVLPTARLAERVRARVARCAPALGPRTVALKSPYTSDPAR